MPQDLKKVRPGEKLRIPASTFNTFIDVANDFKRRQSNQSAAPLQGEYSSHILLVKNDSGQDVRRFGVLGVSSVLYGPEVDEVEFKNRPCLVGVAPTVSSHSGKWVVLLDNLVAGAVGRAMVEGIVPMRVIVTEAADSYVEVEDYRTDRMKTIASGGARILYLGPEERQSPGEEDERWAMIRFPPGGNLPTPRLKYQYLGTVDDALTIAFDYVRFHE